jgi:hypothetical protein
MNEGMKLSDYDHPWYRQRQGAYKPAASREENLRSIFMYCGMISGSGFRLYGIKSGLPNHQAGNRVL